MDLPAHSIWSLQAIEAQSLAWRTEGELLAMIKGEQENSPQMMVLDPITGQIIERRSFYLLMPDSSITPSSQWKVNFAQANSGLEACVTPP